VRVLVVDDEPVSGNPVVLEDEAMVQSVESGEACLAS
jgi:hypothetical protein